MADLFRPPLGLAQQRKKQLGSVLPVSNLLLTTLASAAAAVAPFLPQAPLSPQPKRADLSAFMSVTVLQNDPGVPFSPVDQSSLPRRKFQASLDGPPNILITGIPQPIPWKTYHFTSPQQKRPVVAEQQLNTLLLGITPPVVTLPIFPVDTTQVPKRKKSHAGTEPVFDAQLNVLFVAPGAPFRPVDQSRAGAPRKIQIQVDIYENFLPRGISPPIAPVVPFAHPSDWGQVPSWGYQLGFVSPPNLLETTLAPIPTPTSTKKLRRPGGRMIFDAKKVGETIPRYYDFISSLGEGETIASALVTCSVYSGVDPTPSAVISGVADISGSVVGQDFTAGVSGTVYGTLCRIVTSSGAIVEQAAFLAVIPDFP